MCIVVVHLNYWFVNNFFVGVELSLFVFVLEFLTKIPLLRQLDLVLKDEAGGDLSDFITNGEWYLIGECSNSDSLNKQLSALNENKNKKHLF